jgi:hypothetical protein
MKVFISWSGEFSKTVAQALRKWLPNVLQTIQPWISTEIKAGARWSEEIALQLSETQFGIICVTPLNQRAPWLLFEAGALAKTLHNTYVCPYLIGLKDNDIQDSPLTQFQTKEADESGTWELVCSINKSLKSPLAEEILKSTFSKWWPDLDSILRGTQNPEEMPEVEENSSLKLTSDSTPLRIDAIPINIIIEEMIEKSYIIEQDFSNRFINSFMDGRKSTHIDDNNVIYSFRTLLGIINLSLAYGVPAFNSGDHVKCAKIYLRTLDILSYLSNKLEMPSFSASKGENRAINDYYEIIMELDNEIKSKEYLHINKDNATKISWKLRIYLDKICRHLSILKVNK